MDVKTSILEAGSALLARDGIAALTQLKVARAAGVKQSHLTYYFPRRADLLLGIAAHSVDALLAQLAARLASTPPAVAFPEAMAAAMVNGIPPRVMLGLIVAAEEEPALRVPLTRLVRHIRGRIEKLMVQAGLAARPDAALLFHGVVVGLAVMHQAQGTALSAREAKAGVAGMLSLLSGAVPPAAAVRVKRSAAGSAAVKPGKAKRGAGR